MWNDSVAYKLRHEVRNQLQIPRHWKNHWNSKFARKCPKVFCNCLLYDLATWFTSQQRVFKNCKRCVTSHFCFHDSTTTKTCVFYTETIYLDFLAVLSFLGIMTSSFLIFGIAKQKTALMIWWICSQGILIVYQILITIDFAFGCCKFMKFQSAWAVFTASLVIFLIVLQVYFMVFITKLYQNIVREKTELGRPKGRKYTLETAAITPNDLLHIWLKLIK